VSVWLATVVLGRHYIIDLVLGAFYAWVSVWIVSRYLNRRTATSTSQPGNSTEEKTAV
jgi:membrane-associated phospholipid phosphatase